MKVRTYIKMEQEVLNYLKSEVKFRERCNKDRGIVNLLLTKYKTIFLADIPKETLISFIQDANSMDRYWRKQTGLNPELRGSDYDTKKLVVQRKQIELGYEENYYNNIKNA